jgi:hypothetical protein
MTTVYRHPDGELTVPFSAESPDGFLGCGYETIGPAHPDWAAWQDAIDRDLTDVVDDSADPSDD